MSKVLVTIMAVVYIICGIVMTVLHRKTLKYKQGKKDIVKAINKLSKK